MLIDFARLERPPLLIEIFKNGHIKKKQTDGLGQEIVRC
jgi:hypothetical protein